MGISRHQGHVYVLQGGPELLHLVEGGGPVGQSEAELGLTVRGGEDGLSVEVECEVGGAAAVLLIACLAVLLGLDLVFPTQSSQHTEGHQVSFNVHISCFCAHRKRT